MNNLNNPLSTGSISFSGGDLVAVRNIYGPAAGAVYQQMFAGGGPNGLGVVLAMYGNNSANGLQIFTPNTAKNADVLRLQISNNLDTTVMTVAATQVKLNLPTSNPGPGILWANLGIVTVGT